MLRVITIALISLMLVASADARTRIRVQKDITLQENPWAVQFFLSAFLCHFAIGATPPGAALPPCATPHAAPRRRLA